MKHIDIQITIRDPETGEQVKTNRTVLYSTYQMSRFPQDYISDLFREQFNVTDQAHSEMQG